MSKKIAMTFYVMLLASASVFCSVDEKRDESFDDHTAPSDMSDTPLLSDSSTTHAFVQPRFRYPVAQQTELIPATLINADPGLRKGRLAFTITALTSANIYAYKKFENIWWNYSKSPFHFYRGWRQTTGWYDFGPDDSLWHHMDKFGHYYGSRMLSLFLSDTAQWIGFDDNASHWIGAVASWLFYLQIEIFDGQFEQWGFSLGDLAANTAGAFMPVVSADSPFLQKFSLKMSYAPREIQLQQHMVEDYAGMTYWLTSNPQKFLHFMDPVWPDFMNLALGYSISQKSHGHVELYFSLDYDLTKIETRSFFWNRVLFYLNFVHLPAPAIKFKPTTDYYLFYY